MTHTVDVFQDDAGEWRWHRTAENGQVVADSGEGYVRKNAALDMAVEVNGHDVQYTVEGVEAADPILHLHPERDLGWALARLREGKRVARRGWNGKGQYLFLQGYLHEDFGDFVAIAPVSAPHMPWLCSASDLLATDWEVFE